MFAVVGLFNLDPAVASTRDRGVEDIAARVALRPGFVAGYWSESKRGTVGHSYVVFELRQQADEYAATVRQNSFDHEAAGVKAVSVTLAEITATARGSAQLPRP